MRGVKTRRAKVESHHRAHHTHSVLNETFIVVSSVPLQRDDARRSVKWTDDVRRVAEEIPSKTSIIEILIDGNFLMRGNHRSRFR